MEKDTETNGKKKIKKNKNNTIKMIYNKSKTTLLKCLKDKQEMQ